MAVEISPILRLILDGTKTREEDCETAEVRLSESAVYHWDDGEVDLLWTDRRSVAAGASDDIDLSGSLTDSVFGTDCDFAVVNALVVYSTSDDNEILTVGGDGANGFTDWLADASDKVRVLPGGFLALVAPGDGYEVTADTGDILRISAGSVGSGASEYDIWIIGSAAAGS